MLCKFLGPWDIPCFISESVYIGRRVYDVVINKERASGRRRLPQVHKSWLDLGGTESASFYLEEKEPEVSLVPW